jgi:hypothetical protein
MQERKQTLGVAAKRAERRRGGDMFLRNVFVAAVELLWNVPISQ